MKKLFTLIIVALTLPALAQISVPQPSPLGSIEQKVGLTEISITYSRPSVKGRTIFGKLVPYDVMWRTGANASTKIKFSDDVTIANELVPAGEYALYTIPGEHEWTVILHKNLKYWGTGGKNYKEEEDQLRFVVQADNNHPIKVESMTFNICNISKESCQIELLWDNTRVFFNVDTEVDSRVMAEIEEKMKGVSASTYYQSARYYLENDKDLEQALEWINMALADNEKFWVLRQKSLIQAKLGKYDDAIKTAERSKELATEAGNDHYVMLNTDSIAEWSKKK